MNSTGMWRRVVGYKTADISGEHTVPIFTDKEQAKQPARHRQQTTDDGVTAFLRDVSEILPNYTAAHSRR
jgi:hypothetical protein